MPPLLVLIGPHGAGKTTLGKLVATALGRRFEDEIGYRFRLEALARDRNAHALRPQEELDRRIFEEELARDMNRSAPAVVETWHLGHF